MPLTTWVKSHLIDTPFEGIARDIYTRLNPSLSGRYDQQALAVMKRCLKKDSNCIDVGAFRGGFLREMLRCSPQGTHYAFEPVPRQYCYLVKTYPAVKIYPLALSNTSGEVSFVHVISRPTCSGLRQVQDLSGMEHTETIRVQTERMDQIIPASLPVHLIKVDVEGAELLVFSGGIETLRRNRPVIVFEHGLAAAAAYETCSGDVYDLLKQECGLDIYLMGEWLSEGHPLDRARFEDEVGLGRNYYFMAISNQ
jgi:FkbM family methyltransferase